MLLIKDFLKNSKYKKRQAKSIASKTAVIHTTDNVNTYKHRVKKHFFSQNEQQGKQYLQLLLIDFE